MARGPGNAVSERVAAVVRELEAVIDSTLDTVDDGKMPSLRVGVDHKLYHRHSWQIRDWIRQMVESIYKAAGWRGVSMVIERTGSTVTFFRY